MPSSKDDLCSYSLMQIINDSTQNQKHYVYPRGLNKALPVKA